MATYYYNINVTREVVSPIKRRNTIAIFENCNLFYFRGYDSRITANTYTISINNTSISVPIVIQYWVRYSCSTTLRLISLYDYYM